MKSCLVADLALVLSTVPALAGQWKTEEDKGIFLHSVQQGRARLEMVCDPDGIWLPPEFHVLVTDAGAVLDGTTVEVRTDTETLSYPLSGGAILGATPEGWNRLVAALSHPGTMSFSTASRTVSFDIENSLTADCIRTAPPG